MLLFPYLTGKLGEQQFKFLRLQNKLNRIDFCGITWANFSNSSTENRQAAIIKHHK